jgi:hypothetical protein
MVFEPRPTTQQPALSRLAIALVALLFTSSPACDGGNPSALFALAGGSGTLSGDLVVTLSWSAMANLDLGSTNPPGDNFVAANFESDPDAAPNCLHSGDTQVAGVESFTCTMPLTGGYRVVIDNYSQLPVPYNLSVTVNNAAVSGFPVNRTIPAAPVAGQTMRAHTFSL